MLCLDQEMGLLDEGVSIQFFDKSIKNGTSIIEALKLDDAIFDIDNKSMTHRPDLWGHYGLSREVAALYNKDLADYNPPEIKSGKDKLKVKIEDKKLCPRYMAVAVEGIKVESSPDWLQKNLIAIGLRPINNIVDITNYIMYELGQPMHAFDSTTLESNSIIVRRAEDGENFITLDDSENKLDNRDLVIADKKKPIALAGIMGGKNTEIKESTKIIIFESANFEPANIRRTANRLGLRTDSSSRFEKSLDPNNCGLALRKAVELTIKLCPNAKVSSNLVDESNFSLQTGPIELNWEFLWKKIGVELDKKQVNKILISLGFEVKEKKESLIVKVPTWRATKDISIPEDLVEEISRIYGYDNIKRELPSFPITPPEANGLRQLERESLGVLVNNLGYSEVYNYSFVSESQINKIGDNTKDYIELDNPISKEKPYLRRNLLLNLLENVNKNIEFFDEVKLVEVGKAFIKEQPGERTDKNGDSLLPRQDIFLTAVVVNKKDQVPFWQARSVIEMISSHFNLDLKLESKGQVNVSQHPARSSSIVFDNQELGDVYELHPMVADNFGLESRVGVVEINLNKLLEVVGSNNLKYKKISNYPEMIRDLAFVVKDEVTNGQVMELLNKIDPLLKNIDLFDVYQGKNIGEGYKSMAYRLTYGNNERTLTADEVDKIQAKIIGLLEKNLKAEIRK
jgi:phenylalanyl-tRNA synthetase beta chain